MYIIKISIKKQETFQETVLSKHFSWKWRHLTKDKLLLVASLTGWINTICNQCVKSTSQHCVTIIFCSTNMILLRISKFICIYIYIYSYNKIVICIFCLLRTKRNCIKNDPVCLLSYLFSKATEGISIRFGTGVHQQLKDDVWFYPYQFTLNPPFIRT
jgi:hypothetical protein